MSEESTLDKYSDKGNEDKTRKKQHKASNNVNVTAKIDDHLGVSVDNNWSPYFIPLRKFHRNLGLTLSELMVIECIMGHSVGYGLGHDTIENETGLYHKTINKAITRLVKDKVIGTTRNGVGLNNSYNLKILGAHLNAILIDNTYVIRRETKKVKSGEKKGQEVAVIPFKKYRRKPRKHKTPMLTLAKILSIVSDRDPFRGDDKDPLANVPMDPLGEDPTRVNPSP